jgi:hypothetical protein
MIVIPLHVIPKRRQNSGSGNAGRLPICETDKIEVEAHLLSILDTMDHNINSRDTPAPH